MVAQAEARNPNQSPTADAAQGVVPASAVTTGLLGLLASVPGLPSAKPGLPAHTPGSSAALMPQFQTDGGSLTQQPQTQPTANAVLPPARQQETMAPPQSSPFAVMEIQSRPDERAAAKGNAVSFDELMGGQALDGAGRAVSGLDHMRQELFGKYYEETEARMRELKTALDGGLARGRQAAIDRVDELSSAIHRDMVAIRQEVHSEIEDLKRDVFSAVMSLSALSDKLGAADAKSGELVASVSKALIDRMDQQAAALDQYLHSFQSQLDEVISHKVSTTLQHAIQELIRTQQSQNNPA
ncbi:MAG: hypothetical protein JNJ83_01760 [Verrucomicrobiaceae bacterium]|nr:hypothetical protein [Verrucomicrobiaceae bacterium]